MWKPGTEKPQASRKDPQSVPDGRHTDGAMPPPTASKKRLSGLTMNMRFMKRKMEAIQSETQRQSDSASEQTPSGPNKRIASNIDARKNSKMDHGEEAIDMEVCEQDRNTNDSREVSQYEQATSIDMYGAEASIIGRRSFADFNPPMERAWKDSKASTENSNGAGTGSRQKISDEELMQRYQSISQQRGVRNL